MSDNFSFRWGVPILDAGFTDIPNVILRNYVRAGVKRHEFLLIMHLASYRYNTPGSESFPSLASISKQTGWTVQRICQIANELEEKGMLRRIRRTGTTTIYDFTGFSESVLKAAALASIPTQASLIPPSQASLSTPLKPALHEEENKKRKERIESTENETFIQEMADATIEEQVKQEQRIPRTEESYKAELVETAQRMYERQTKDISTPAQAGGDDSPAKAIADGICRYNGHSQGILEFPETQRVSWRRHIAGILSEWGGATVEQARLAWQAWTVEYSWKSRAEPFYANFGNELGPLLVAVRGGGITTATLAAKAAELDEKSNGKMSNEEYERAETHRLMKQMEDDPQYQAFHETASQ